MIDIHCHILPQVDDGPNSIEEAMRMVALAYEDGVRCIIATPHKNHTMAFEHNGDIASSYRALRAFIKETYPDLGIVLGCELFIRKDYLTLLKESPYDFSMAGTQYVLMEFPTEVTHQEMLDVVHEFKLRGYKPILAHIEVYPNVFGDLEKVRSLREKGAYIQITGNGLTGKQGNTSTVFLKKLIRLGLVDFIASDGHHDTVRRPLLASAYKAVADMMTEKEATRLFVQNPKLLMVGKDIAQPTHAMKTGGTKGLRLNLVAVALTLVLLTASALIAVGNRDEALAKEIKEAKERSAIIKTYHLDATTEETKGLIEAQVTDAAVETENGTKTENRTETNTTKSVGVSQVSIENGYLEALNILKDTYIAELDGIVANVKVANSAINDEAQRNALIDSYYQEIMALEQNSDNAVNALLYKMQNELEKNKFDKSKVQEMRDGYYQIKLDKQNGYLKELGYSN